MKRRDYVFPVLQCVLLVILWLMAGDVFGQVVSTDPQTRYRDTDTSITAGGLWRWRFNGSSATLEMNTAAAGSFGTLTEHARFTSGGNFWLGGNETNLWGTGARGFIYSAATGAYSENLVAINGYNPSSNGGSAVGTFSLIDVPITNTRDIAALIGGVGEVIHRGTGTVTSAYGQYDQVVIRDNARATDAWAGFAIATSRGTSITTRLYGMEAKLEVIDTANVTNGYGLAVKSPSKAGGATLTNNYGLYLADQAVGTCPYALWYNGVGSGAGVFRINHLGVTAYYNPGFAAYTPCASNYERIVQQWTSNVAEVGAEAGGTGTLRSLRLLGASVMMDGANQYIETLEGAEPAAPSANRARLFTRDNGSGKTQLCVRFATGASQCFATEP